VKVRYSRAASEDLAALYAYVRADNPKAAGELVETIIRRIERLPDTPEIGRPGKASGTRELVVTRTPYVVVYGLDKTSIVIFRVLHGRRRWPPA